jgi:hypothetical protein
MESLESRHLEVLLYFDECSVAICWLSPLYFHLSSPLWFDVDSIHCSVAVLNFFWLLAYFYVTIYH